MLGLGVGVFGGVGVGLYLYLLQAKVRNLGELRGRAVCYMRAIFTSKSGPGVQKKAFKINDLHYFKIMLALFAAVC